MLEKSGLTEQQVDEAAWALTPDGELYGGAAAISIVMGQAIGIGRFIYWVYAIPGIRQIEDWVYRWVARNRHLFGRFFSQTPAIKQQPPWQPMR